MLDEDEDNGNKTLTMLINKLEISQNDTLFMGRNEQIEAFMEKMKEREMKRLLGEDFEYGSSSQDEKKKALKAKMKIKNQVGEDFKMNDEDFEDVISLKSN